MKKVLLIISFLFFLVPFASHAYRLVDISGTVYGFTKDRVEVQNGDMIYSIDLTRVPPKVADSWKTPNRKIRARVVDSSVKVRKLKPELKRS